jgi:RNA polymerase sigma-70 factor
MTDPEVTTESYERFLRCFSQDRERIFAYIYSLLPQRADAEDVFQRCSLLLWRKFADFETDREFMPWACGVAFYEVRNFLRVAARDRLQFNDELIQQLADRRMETLRQDHQRLEHLRECLKELKPGDEELIRAAYHLDRSLAEIAESTGRALQTLYNRLNLLRRGLMECVQRKLAAEERLA